MDLPQNDSGVLVISQSGETKDVHRALTVALNKGLPVMSIVNVVGSLIARYSFALLLRSIPYSFQFLRMWCVHQRWT